MLTKPEISEAVDKIRVLNAQPQHPALRAIKAGAGDRNALVKTCHKMLEQRRGGTADIRVAHHAVQLGMCDKGLEQLFFLLILLMAVKIEQVINAEAVRGCHKTVNGNIGLQGAGGADTDYIERGKYGFYLPGGKINIDQRIQLIYHYVNIIRPDAGGEDGDALIAHIAGMADKFPVLVAHFNFVKIFAHFGNTAGVANGDDGGGQFFRAYIQVIYSAPGVDDQFRFSNPAHGMFFSLLSNGGKAVYLPAFLFKANLLNQEQEKKNGPLAEWLGRALQKLVQRFESARDLKRGSLKIIFQAASLLL